MPDDLTSLLEQQAAVSPDTDTSNMDRGDGLDGNQDAGNQGASDKGAADQPRDAQGRFVGTAEQQAQAEADAAAAKEATGAGGADQKAGAEPRIPKSRFDQAVNKERTRAAELEQRAIAAEQALQAQQAAQKQSQDVEAVEARIDELEAQYNEKMLDGLTDEAKALRKEIRHLDRALMRYEQQQIAQTSSSQALAQREWDNTVAELNATYPVLDPRNEEGYDQETVDYILGSYNGKVQRGMPPAAAIRQATEDYFRRLGQAPVVKNASAGLAGGLADRKTAQVEKNLKAAAAQGPNLGQTGLDSTALGKGATTGTTLTYDEFAALPEATVAKMRGDEL